MLSKRSGSGRRWAAGALAALALVAGAQGAAAQTAATVAIADGLQITSYQFGPDTTQINVGDNVSWTNTGRQIHTISSADGVLNSGAINPGETFSFTFTTPGTYAYFCAPHPWMKGTITVLGADAS